MRSDRTPHARRYWAALLLLLTGTLAGAWHNRTVDRGHQDMVGGAARTVVAPPAYALGGASRWLSDQTSWLWHGRAIVAENRRLNARVAELEGENAALAEAQRQNDVLRNDLGFVRSAKPALLAADVLARRADPNFDTILISRGSRDGVHVNSIVRTRAGLVGKVSEVTPTTATVILLLDANGGVGGRVQRAGAHGIGVCKGDPDVAPLLPMIDLPTDTDIKKGDLIVTSGFGTVVQTYPKGIPIGRVVDIKGAEDNFSKTAYLRPCVDFDTLEEVYVLP